jgi:hypothetical protein
VTTASTTSGATGTVGQPGVKTQALVGGSSVTSFVAATGNVSTHSLAAELFKGLEGLAKTLFSFSTVKTGGGVFTPQAFTGSDTAGGVGHSVAEILTDKDNSGVGGSGKPDHGNLPITPPGHHGHGGSDT